MKSSRQNACGITVRRPLLESLESRTLLSAPLNAVSFAAPRSLAAGIHSAVVVVGDFNGDRKPDMAVANEGHAISGRDGSVSVLLGNGNGTFHATRDFRVGFAPWALAAADFNKDGNLDLAMVDGGHNAVRLFWGRGDGTFRAGGRFAVGQAPCAVVTGDFNCEFVTFCRGATSAQ